MSNPKQIWLSPACHEKPHGDGRLWCQDDVWGECNDLDNKGHYCGEKSVRYVLASDYDRLELECADLRASLDGYKNCMRLMVEESTCADWSGENDESIFATAQTWCGKYQHANQERDALRAQVEAMRELLRKVAPHFAAPPGLGYLHADIDAALQANP